MKVKYSLRIMYGVQLLVVCYLLYYIIQHKHMFNPLFNFATITVSLWSMYGLIDNIIETEKLP